LANRSSSRSTERFENIVERSVRGGFPFEHVDTLEHIRRLLYNERGYAFALLAGNCGQRILVADADQLRDNVSVSD